MVGTLTFIALFFSLACSLVFPVVLCIVFLRKHGSMALPTESDTAGSRQSFLWRFPLSI